MHRLLPLALLTLMAASEGERTCNIPVFRYALERWAAAPYEVVAFHRGPLGDEGKAALNALREGGANVAVDRIDVAEPVPQKWQDILEKTKLQVPCMIAVFPGTNL